MRFPDAVRISGMFTIHLIVVPLEVGVHQEFDFWVAGILLPRTCWWGPPGGSGSRAGGSQVGGGPSGGLPYSVSGAFSGAIHSRGNIAR